VDKVRQNPGVAAILSFVFNGLGQLYNGEISKGLAIIFFSSLSLFVFILGSILIALWLLGKFFFVKWLVLGLALFFISLIAIAALGIYSIFDAYKVASR